jgi:HlyD family secretion protein
MEMSRKKLIGATVLALILTAGAAAYGWYGARSAVADFRLAPVERGAITAVVSVTGTLNPVVSVQVGSQVSGQIKEILVDFNSQV